MKEKIINKILLIILTFTICLLISDINVFAATGTCELTVTADKTEIKAGETITFTINISDINVTGGITGLNTLVNYDKDVFTMEIKPSGKWTQMNVENLLNFFSPNYEGTSANQEIGKVIFTAKQDAKIGEKTFSFEKNEVAGENDQLIEKSDITKKIQIVSKDTNNQDGENNQGGADNQGGSNNQGGTDNQGGSNNQGGTGNQGESNNQGGTGNQGESNNQGGTGNQESNNRPGNTNKPSGNTSTQQNGKINNPTSVSNLNIPKTGSKTGIIIAGIIVAILLSIVFYIKYKRSI